MARKSKRPAGVAPVPVEGEEDVCPHALARCATFEENDTGNGRRLLEHFGRDVLYVREVGWHTWGEKRWVREGGDEAVTALAQRTARLVTREADILGLFPYQVQMVEDARPLRRLPRDELTEEQKAAIEAADDAAGMLGGRRTARRKFAITSGNGSRINGMIAQALPHTSIGPRDLDADHLLFNCQNVTLRLSRILDPEDPGDVMPRHKLWVEPLAHDRAHHITKIAPVVYDPNAKCPRWDAFMTRFQPVAAVRKFLQAYHGLALTGLTGHQCFVYYYGSGANGKSTCMEAIASLMGDYSDLLNAESITGQGQRRGDQATPDFAELPGVRYLRISELPRGEDLKEALVKSLTGGEEIKARHLNKGFFKFQPCFKAGMSGNDMPKIGGVDNGIWRRLRLVIWAVIIPEEERRPMADILAEFEEERSGILNWLLEGLDIYMREGLQTPEQVTAATNAYREEMDPIGAFITDCLEPASGQFETARSVYEAYVKWSNANSYRPWKENTFGRVLPQKGIVKENTRVRRYLNVRLHDVPESAPPDPRAPSGGGERE